MNIGDYKHSKEHNAKVDVSFERLYVLIGLLFLYFLSSCVTKGLRNWDVYACIGGAKFLIIVVILALCFPMMMNFEYGVRFIHDYV